MYVAGFGVVMTLPYLIAAIWPVARMLIGFRQPVGIVEHDLYVWAIVAGFGLILVFGGLALGAIGRSEYRRIDEADPSSERRMPNKTSHSNRH